MTVNILESILNKKTDIFMTVHEIFRYIKQSTKKSLMSKISTISLGLKFKLDRNELDKACLDLDVAYSDSKDLVKRTI